MLDLDFSLKELYEVKLKSTYNMKIGDQVFEENETIAFFKSIQISNINEVVKRAIARGGYHNHYHVFWEQTDKILINFNQGVFSKTQFALLSNSPIFNKENNSEIAVDYRQIAESDENGLIILDYRPANFLFCYDAETGQKLSWTLNSTTELNIDIPFKKVFIDYQMIYTNGGKNITIGEDMIKGFLSFEAKTRIKDDVTGQTHTGIIKIPKVRLVSDLSIRLGKNADPVVGNFALEGYPTGGKGNELAMEIYFLEDDLNDDQQNIDIN